MTDPTTAELLDFDVRTSRRLARSLRARRRSLGLTQADVASRAGVSAQWLSEFESGRSPGGTDRVMALLTALGLSLAVHERPFTTIDSILAAHTAQPDDGPAMSRDR